MTDYVVAGLVIFGLNLLPAFAPPTWSILAFFVLTYDLHPVVLIAIGIIGATLGRYLLALAFRAARPHLPQGWVANMENAGSYITHSRGHAWAMFLLFFLSPLSSAQLFEAAGVMKNVALRPLCTAFAAGRVLTYSTYVSGAHLLKESNIGQVITRNIKSPEAIALQIVMVVLLVALGNIKWKPHPQSAL